jgi:hypothetical protein
VVLEEEKLQHLLVLPIGMLNLGEMVDMALVEVEAEIVEAILIVDIMEEMVVQLPTLIN